MLYAEFIASLKIRIGKKKNDLHYLYRVLNTKQVLIDLKYKEEKI